MRGYGDWVQCSAFGDDYHLWEPTRYPRVRPLCGKNGLLLSVWDYEARLGKRAPRGGKVCAECERLSKEK